MGHPCCHALRRRGWLGGPALRGPRAGHGGRRSARPHGVRPLPAYRAGTSCSRGVFGRNARRAGRYGAGTRARRQPRPRLPRTGLGAAGSGPAPPARPAWPAACRQPPLAQAVCRERPGSPRADAASPWPGARRPPRRRRPDPLARAPRPSLRAPRAAASGRDRDAADLPPGCADGTRVNRHANAVRCRAQAQRAGRGEGAVAAGRSCCVGSVCWPAARTGAAGQPSTRGGRPLGGSGRERGQRTWCAGPAGDGRTGSPSPAGPRITGTKGPASLGARSVLAWVTAGWQPVVAVAGNGMPVPPGPGGAGAMVAGSWERPGGVGLWRVRCGGAQGEDSPRGRAR